MGFLDRKWNMVPSGILVPSGKGKGVFIPPGQGGQNPGRGNGGRSGGGGGSGTDPFFSNVVALLHADSNPTGGIDSSSYNRSIINSSGVLDTTNKVFGTGSWSFSAGGFGSGFVNAASLAMGTSNFTIELFVRFNALGSIVFFAGQTDAGGATANTSFILRKEATNKLRAFCGSGASIIGDITGTTTVSSGTFYYVAYVRSGSTFTLYSGTTPGSAVTTEGTASSASSVNSTSSNFSIGSGGDIITNSLSGNIDEFRWTIGTARTITTVPSTAFPNS